MADKEVISVNPNETTDLEFEISTAGLNKKDSRIRLLITDKSTDETRLLKCKSTDSQNWSVKIPTGTFIADHTYTFTMECIIYNYYFEISSGDINFIHEKPAVKVKNTSKKSKKVSESVTEMINENDEQIINEFAASDMTDHSAPTNLNLKTETKPKDTHGKKVRNELDPIDIGEIASEVQPGEGVQYSQPSPSQDIIKKVIGIRKTKVREGKLNLFSTDSTGRVWIPGLENIEQQQTMVENDARVKQILSN